MTPLQKLAIAAAALTALIIIVRKALAYERAVSAEEIPTLQPVADATPRQPEPLDSKNLRVAQNAPL